MPAKGTHDILTEVRRAIRAHGLFAVGDRIVVAVSGGADSVALLHILQGLDEYGLNLVIAHLNHLLRGKEAAEDEAFVRECAKQYGLVCECRSTDVRALSRRDGLSLEAAGRKARYEFLNEVADRLGAARIALAHHADDQAETFLLRLLRGAGSRGLAGMRPLSAGRYVRPLLSVSRAQIEAYLRSRGIGWRTDSSNTDTLFLRNRIRHELLPILAGYNPAISDRLRITAEIMAADNALLEEAGRALFLRLACSTEEGISISLASLREHPDGMRYRLYQIAIEKLLKDQSPLSNQHLQQIDRLLFAPRPNLVLPLPQPVRVVRRYHELCFSQTSALSVMLPYGFPIEGPGSFPLPGGGVLTVQSAELPACWSGVTEASAYVDLDQVPFPWFVRPFRAGDRFRPSGMTGRKKVKDLFIDAKIPEPVRRRLPLLFQGDTLLWVAGVRRAQEGMVGAASQRIIRIDLTGIPLT